MLILERSNYFSIYNLYRILYGSTSMASGNIVSVLLTDHTIQIVKALMSYTFISYTFDDLFMTYITLYPGVYHSSMQYLKRTETMSMEIPCDWI